MKLISTLFEKFGEHTDSPKVSIISESCTLGEAFMMIESWCNDNNADYPETNDLWKYNGSIRISVKTKNHKYINIFEIKN